MEQKKEIQTVMSNDVVKDNNGGSQLRINICYDSHNKTSPVENKKESVIIFFNSDINKFNVRDEKSKVFLNMTMKNYVLLEDIILKHEKNNTKARERARQNIEKATGKPVIPRKKDSPSIVYMIKIETVQKKDCLNIESKTISLNNKCYDESLVKFCLYDENDQVTLTMDMKMYTRLEKILQNYEKTRMKARERVRQMNNKGASVRKRNIAPLVYTIKIEQPT
jgi:hypothetical protein